MSTMKRSTSLWAAFVELFAFGVRGWATLAIVVPVGDEAIN
jgi:hypothetical protein